MHVRDDSSHVVLSGKYSRFVEITPRESVNLAILIESSASVLPWDEEEPADEPLVFSTNTFAMYLSALNRSSSQSTA